MTSATVNSVTTTFAYRGDGLRNSRTTGGVTTTFTWDIAGRLPVVLDDGAKYVYGAGLVSQVSGANTYYYLADGLGSTMKTVDATGLVVNGYTYDTYGKKTSSSGSQANEFDFAGQQTDPTGLQYLRARYYNPETGTFMSREPMAALPGWTGNPFGYGAGNPARYSDPTGLFPIDTDGCGLNDSGCQNRSSSMCTSGGAWCFSGNLTIRWGHDLNTPVGYAAQSFAWTEERFIWTHKGEYPFAPKRETRNCGVLVIPQHYSDQPTTYTGGCYADASFGDWSGISDAVAGAIGGSCLRDVLSRDCLLAAIEVAAGLIPGQGAQFPGIDCSAPRAIRPPDCQ